MRELARRAGVPWQRVQSLESPTAKGEPTHSKYLQPVKFALADRSEGKEGGDVKYKRIPTLDMGESVPVYDLRGNSSGGVEMSGLVVNTIKRPGNLSHIADAYGVQMRDATMSPMYRPGDILIVNPHAVPRIEAGVLIMSEDRHDVRVGEFVSETDTAWTVKKYGDKPETVALSKAKFPLCHCVCVIFPSR